MFKLFLVFYFPYDTTDGPTETAVVVVNACSATAKAEALRTVDTIRTKG